MADPLSSSVYYGQGDAAFSLNRLLSSVFNRQSEHRLNFRELGRYHYNRQMNNYLTSEEFDPLLYGRDGILVFDLMRRQSSQISAALDLLKLPILDAAWKVESKDEEATKFIEENLGLSSSNNSFQRFLREALSSLEFGFSLFETVFEYREGKHWLTGCQYRYQISIEEFEDDGIDLTAVKQIQQLYPIRKVKRIPADQLLYFAPRKEGNDWWGRSVIRPGYNDWYILSQLYLIAASAQERFGLPVPYAKYNIDGKYPPPDQDEIEYIAQGLSELSGNVRSFMLTSSLWEVDFLHPDMGSAEVILQFINHHLSQISKSILAPYFDLGTTEHGSRAVSESFSDIFYTALAAYADYFAEKVNNILIPRILTFNYGEKHPEVTLMWSNMKTQTFEKRAEALARLASEELINHTPETEELLRKQAQLPLEPGTPQPKEAPKPAGGSFR